MKRFNQIRRFGAAVLVAVVAAPAFAAGTDPISSIFAGINMETAVTAVVALLITGIGVALAFKGSSLGKKAITQA